MKSKDKDNKRNRCNAKKKDDTKKNKAKKKSSSGNKLLKKAPLRSVYRKKKGSVPQIETPPIVIDIENGLSPREISDLIRLPVSKILAHLINLGVVISETQKIKDKDTLELIFLEFAKGTKLLFEEKKIDIISEEKTTKASEIIHEEPHVQQIKKIGVVKKEIPPNYIRKIPVVTVMGHVDHGKTTLLDTIRKTNVVAQEYGAITQHIGAYKVKYKENFITFIDTPGHEAFSAIRARGAKVTDIVVLVVAGDEGIMPQTRECIDHIKTANVPFIVAINKIDIPQCNVNNVKKQFSDIGIIPADWGGNVEFVEISARNGINIDKLLEALLIQSELMELYVPIDVPAEAVVVETKFDQKRGFVATVIVTKGILKIGNSFVGTYSYGKVRSIFDEYLHVMQEVRPGEPAEIIGFEIHSTAGDTLKVVSNEKEAKKIYEDMENEKRLNLTKTKRYLTIDDIISGKSNVLSLVIKTDTHGSLEAINKMLKILSDEIKDKTELPELKITHISIGEIKETDVLLATASNAIIIGFNVRPTTQALKKAKNEGVEIRTYRLIYDLIDDVKNILRRLEIKKEVEEFLGRARVKKVFDVPKVGKVCGCIVEEGKIVRNAKVRVLRDNVIVTETKISSLKHFKEDVKEIQQGFECGIGLENFQNVEENDVIECFQIVTK
ncbi:MAG: translation initiation factor IF-2 [Endomicrobia bacterium]|nr:translation initiation factor IF-2 [Endomicrobiia bacterium]